MTASDLHGRVLAVDIGAHGAAALLDEVGVLLDVVDLPTLDAGPACRPEISPHLFAAIVRQSISSFLELVMNEALSDCVVELVRGLALWLRMVVNKGVDAPFAIADCGHDVHQPPVQARAIVGDRLSLLWSRDARRDVQQRFIGGFEIGSGHGVAPAVARLRNGACFMFVSFQPRPSRRVASRRDAEGDCLDHNRAEVALIGWAGRSGRRPGGEKQSTEINGRISGSRVARSVWVFVDQYARVRARQRGF